MRCTGRDGSGEDSGVTNSSPDDSGLLDESGLLRKLVKRLRAFAVLAFVVFPIALALRLCCSLLAVPAAGAVELAGAGLHVAERVRRELEGVGAVAAEVAVADPGESS